MAQLKTTFEKGSIIQNDNKKTDGFIKTDDLSALSSKICFKLLETDEQCTEYNTNQVKSLNTQNGKFFDKLTIKMNKNKDGITVFANLILKGNISLYKSVYNEKNFFYHC